MEITPIYPPNLGWLQIKLRDSAVEHLWKCIEQPQGKYKDKLVGIITDSQLINDIDNWFFDNVLMTCCQEYDNYFYNLGNYIPVNQPHPYFLSSMWVNQQRQHEFNPRHKHFGVYSFVVWMKIPTRYEDQAKLDIASETIVQEVNAMSGGADQPSAVSNFQFDYSNILGENVNYLYEMFPERSGTMLFFPSQLNHTIYPFYNCEEDRITISGNLFIDTTRTNG